MLIPQKMARYFRENFGEKLCTEVDGALHELPSPNALQNKILIKVSELSSNMQSKLLQAKKLPKGVEEAEISDSEDEIG